MYAKIENGNIVQYPITDLRKHITDVLLPASILEEMLPQGYVKVTYASIPQYSSNTHKVVPKTTPELVDGKWVIGYDVIELGAVELSNIAEGARTAVVASVQQRLDEFARTRGYDSILSACTYATSQVPDFAVEGQYCVAVRDQTWAKLHQIMTEVEAGARPLPTGYSDIENELPVLEWPL